MVCKSVTSLILCVCDIFAFPAIWLVIVVAKFGSSPNAAANSFNVSSVSGAESTSAAIFASTSESVAYSDGIDVIGVIVLLPNVITPLDIFASVIPYPANVVDLLALRFNALLIILFWTGFVDVPFNSESIVVLLAPFSILSNFVLSTLLIKPFSEVVATEYVVFVSVQGTLTTI